VQIVNVIVVGYGLAGAWVAYELAKRGAIVSVVDSAQQTSATSVAAGLVNPITGTRPRSSWRYNEFFDVAHSAYRELERQTGVVVFREVTIRRVFGTPQDVHYWELAARRGLPVPWTSIPPGQYDGVPMPLGGVEYPGAVVNTQQTTMALSTAASIDVEHRTVEMWESWLPFQPVQGEILDVEYQGPLLSSVYLRGTWVVPYESIHSQVPAHRARVGATDNWDFLRSEGTEQAASALLQSAQTLLHRNVVVVKHQAGIRPAMKHKRPVCGRHPRHPQHLILNGLGSKGSLWAPWMAQHLADHIMKLSPVNEDLSPMRFWSSHA
jgi:glycine oxidase